MQLLCQYSLNNSNVGHSHHWVSIQSCSLTKWYLSDAFTKIDANDRHNNIKSLVDNIFNYGHHVIYRIHILLRTTSELIETWMKFYGIMGSNAWVYGLATPWAMFFLKTVISQSKSEKNAKPWIIEYILWFVYCYLTLNLISSKLSTSFNLSCLNPIFAINP